MMRSLSMAIAALRNHQVYMDVISSNITNVNTTGYKTSRIGFQELLSQTLRGSSAPRGGLGGLNPIQISLGMALGGVDTLFTQGGLQDTGRLTDLAVQGEGFFVLNSGEGYSYSRDGNLDVGVDGSLLQIATGMRVQGWKADDLTYEINTGTPATDIFIPVGERLARATSNVEMVGNLDAESVVGDNVVSTMAVYDSLGVQHEVTMTYAKTGTNTWSWTAAYTGPDSDANGTPDYAVTLGNNSGTLTFNTDGSYTGTTPILTMTGLPAATGAKDMQGDPATGGTGIALDFSAVNQLTGTSEVNISNQNGLPPGSLTTFTIGSLGEINGIFSNGLSRPLGRIAMAKFLNPGGLVKMGQSLYGVSANSGDAQIGVPGQDGRGQISSGYLEMSNVELAQQFTNMIVAQRGFQANSRVITASDEMLQELVNLTR